MTTERWDFTYENESDFTLGLLRDEANRIHLRVEGIAHPGAPEDWDYMGEESKNPRLKKATDIAAGIFADWVASLDKEILDHFTFQPIRNTGQDAKICGLTSHHSSDIPADIARSLDIAFPRLREALSAGKTAIEQAIAEGKGISLDDPKRRIGEATAQALADMVTGQSNLEPRSAVENMREAERTADPDASEADITKRASRRLLEGYAGLAHDKKKDDGQERG